MVRLKKKQPKIDESLPPGACRMVDGTLFQWTEKDHRDVFDAYHNIRRIERNSIEGIDEYLEKCLA